MIFEFQNYHPMIKLHFHGLSNQMTMLLNSQPSCLLSSAWSVEEIFAGKMSHFKNIAMTLCMHHICFAVVKASFTLDVILMWTLQWPYQKGWMSVTLALSLFGVNRLILSSVLLSSHETYLWVNNLCTLSLTRRHNITFRLKASDLCVGWYAVVLKGSKGELSHILY